MLKRYDIKTADEHLKETFSNYEKKPRLKYSFVFSQRYQQFGASDRAKFGARKKRKKWNKEKKIQVQVSRDARASICDLGACVAVI